MSNESPVYSEEYMIKTLAYMLANTQFRDIAIEANIRDHFVNRALQWYYDTIAQAKIPLTVTTLKEELIKASKTRQIKETEVDKIAEYYTFIKQPLAPFEEQHIQESFSKFIRTQAMKQAILESLDLIKNEQWDEVLEKVEVARNKGIDILTIGHRYFEDFEARLAQRLSQDEIRRLGTGIPALDELTNGGLKNKQLGLVVGGSGRGKSIFLEWLAKVAIILGKQVVYYTLELSEEDISERFDSLFCHIKPKELKSLNTQVFQEMHKYHKQFGNQLIIKEYPEDEASINTLKAHYKQLGSIGVKPDLIIIDYIDLMKPHRTYKDVNQEQAAIVKAVRGLTKKFNTRVWSALQFNRGGMVAETPDESGVAGSIARMFTTDILIFMAQTKEEYEDEVMRLYLKKNRNGPAERIIKIATDFQHMKFYRGDVVDSTIPGMAAEVLLEAETELEQTPADFTGDVVLD